MFANDRKDRLKALHSDTVNKAVKSHERNTVLNDRSPPIDNSEKELTRNERTTLAQPKSGYYVLLGSYKSRIKKDASPNVGADCGMTPHDAKHLFVFPTNLTTLPLSDLWSRPADSIPESAISRQDTQIEMNMK